MELKINHIQHIGIPVTDLKTSQAFYERLGFNPVMNSTFMHKGAEGKVLMMKRQEIIMELYQMPEPELNNVKKRKDGHIDHITFDVDDIDETYLLLKNNGFSIDEEKPVYLGFWEKGCKYFNVIGPDGERLEFNQIL